jgi:hypothetical protein
MNPDQLYGTGDIEAFFAGHPRTLVPWPRAPRRKHTLLITDDERRALLTTPPALADLDPRTLYATQTWVLAQHCRYYATGVWERTGAPAQDRDQLANRYPLIHTDAGRHIILGGHHRALAALLTGTPLRARVLRTRNEATAVLPHLLVGAHTSLNHTTTANPERAAELITTGTTVLVPHLNTAPPTQHTLGLDEAVTDDRNTVPTTGRVHRDAGTRRHFVLTCCELCGDAACHTPPTARRMRPSPSSSPTTKTRPPNEPTTGSAANPSTPNPVGRGRSGRGPGITADTLCQSFNAGTTSTSSRPDGRG